MIKCQSVQIIVESVEKILNLPIKKGTVIARGSNVDPTIELGDAVYFENKFGTPFIINDTPYETIDQWMVLASFNDK